MKKIIVSGIRPTGKIHLGHVVGAITNWIKLQNDYECYIFIADWHAMTSHSDVSRELKQYSYEIVSTFLAFGLDPSKVTIFEQSKIPEHLELYYILSCITPLGWLERCPTYKEQIKNVQDKELNNYAFLGYPVLQAADILLYKGEYVPVGEDQIPHLELTREIARRFNSIYGTFFPEPQPLLTTVSKLLGIDARKMSKSYNNAINITDTSEEIKHKTLQMFTDPSRIKRTDPGHPEICNVYSYYKIFAPTEASKTEYECKNAIRGCTDCKSLLANKLLEYILPYSDKVNYYLNNISEIQKILEEGNKKAKSVASKNIAEIKKLVFG
jgi:tryptophanyl-tRNA synthetase